MVGFDKEVPEEDLATVDGLLKFEADYEPVPNFFFELEFSLGDCVCFFPLDWRFEFTS